GVAVDPVDPKVLYLSSAGGGAWRSKNNGLTWEPLIDEAGITSVPGIPDFAEVMFTRAIAVAPTNSNVIYVGLGESNNSGDSFYGRGVLKSSDYGRTWTLLSPDPNAFDRHTISKMVVDPGEPNTLYVALADHGVNDLPPTSNGIWRLRNGTWIDL